MLSSVLGYFLPRMDGRVCACACVYVCVYVCMFVCILYVCMYIWLDFQKGYRQLKPGVSTSPLPKLSSLKLL